MDLSEIESIYSYDSQERSDFKYLDEYMSKVDLPSILREPVGVERFCLAGLFLTYRACNHMGVPLSTTKVDENMAEPHYSRLAKFGEATGGRAIESAEQYRQMLGIGVLSLFGNPGRKLIRFATGRKPIRWA